jgi:shikimate dehydrogenase
MIHQLFAQQTNQQLNYIASEVPAEKFDDAVQNFIHQGGKGLNCTVPLKQLAWQKADVLSERAKLSKAVNTLVIHSDGRLTGDNTDGIGLVTDLTVNHDIDLAQKRILILGAGGATRGIITPILQENPAQLVIANRTVETAISLAGEFNEQAIVGCGFEDLSGQQFEIIINATSASLSNELPPLPENLLAKNSCCYDLAYANEATPFVRWGQKSDAKKSLDGLGMLVEQAAEAFYIWRGVRPDTQQVIKRLNKLG